MYGSAADAKLDAMWEAREQDPPPDETPPTDEEVEAMYQDYRAWHRALAAEHDADER